MELKPCGPVALANPGALVDAGRARGASTLLQLMELNSYCVASLSRLPALVSTEAGSWHYTVTCGNGVL